MLVKICGLTTETDAVSCAEEGADMLGFVFAPSPRRISTGQARRIMELLPGEVSTVGVFLDQPLEDVAETARELELDYIQLHGDETPDYCERLARISGTPIIKAITIGKEQDIELAGRYSIDSVSYLLLDSRAEGRRGGTGRTFPWDIADRSVPRGKPLIVAGGLTSSNVREAIRRFSPEGVDVSSGVERGSRAGIKDMDEVRRFIREAKA